MQAGLWSSSLLCSFSFSFSLYVIHHRHARPAWCDQNLFCVYIVGTRVYGQCMLLLCMQRHRMMIHTTLSSLSKCWLTPSALPSFSPLSFQAELVVIIHTLSARTTRLTQRPGQQRLIHMIRVLSTTRHAGPGAIQFAPNPNFWYLRLKSTFQPMPIRSSVRYCPTMSLSSSSVHVPRGAVHVSHPVTELLHRLSVATRIIFRPLPHVLLLLLLMLRSRHRSHAVRPRRRHGLPFV